ncbi:3',5'-cyclic-AMP phosphodiesterase [Egbenema bharatensis]|uniref:3',5'-cyclic-AMP phosphodiesterase n=1 Tax=Egbenema bharatensis TaxID=3463334 RepID=UPI003A897607
MTNSPVSLRVAQITDTHLFADPEREMMGCVTARSLQAVLAQLQQVQPQPDVLLLTGDLSQDETTESYEQLQSHISALGIPAYWIPGNHDRPELMDQVLATAPISTQKAIQCGGWNLLLLTSSIAGRVEGGLSAETLDWLEQQLQASDHPTLIALHHPPLLIDSEWMDQIGLRNATDLFAILDRNPQVKLVLFGHIHQEFIQTRNGVTYLGTPSTCVQFEPRQAQFAIGSQKPGFRLLTLFPNGSHSTVVQRVELE